MVPQAYQKKLTGYVPGTCMQISENMEPNSTIDRYIIQTSGVDL